ncbi:CD82 antigen-like isoform X2 [Hypanus sabinus]|nr:CD82 antigen-like isoform X2 [Hypanus sabinus]XP_059809672.1 CD82 antigen-like isoform X2 [Hypanus sabinus]XP_059809674.1 CD82 antigen-like isoform X2 [Hypanus sabinus]
MASKSCIVITKYFLFIFNLFFFFLGGVMLGFGLWILIDKMSFIAMLDTASVPLQLWSYLFSGLGIFTMMMGFLGCIGALKEIKCMLGIYFTLLVFLMASQITVGVLVYTQRKVIDRKLSFAVKDMIKKYDPNDKQLQNLEDSWDYIQLKFACCGWNNSQEWLKNPNFSSNSSGSLLSESQRYPFPCSCQSSFFKNFTYLNHTEEFGICWASSNPLTVKIQGCRRRVFEWVQENVISITIICIGITVVELMLLALSSVLLVNIHMLSTAVGLLQPRGATAGPSGPSGVDLEQTELPAKPSFTARQGESQGSGRGTAAEQTVQEREELDLLAQPSTTTEQTLQEREELDLSDNSSTAAE